MALARTVVGRPGDQVVGRALAAGLVGYGTHLLFAFGEATLDPLAWLLAGILVVVLPARAATPPAATGAS